MCGGLSGLKFSRDIYACGQKFSMHCFQPSTMITSSPIVQIDPREQLSIALYRMGHLRNAIAMGDVLLWAGRGMGL